MEALEKELLLLVNNKKTNTVTKSTQTSTLPRTNTFESTPEAFNLLPARQGASWQKIVANEDHLSSVVNALQEIKIDSHIDTHVQSWLNQTVTDHQQGKLRRPCL